ncbi:MMPL family transporter [Planococcus sp. S3-L1]|uniref:MMPL family transporter n=1 Tax=Planococcus sp. S3-L1 TaxID=3046200 RepID=UPI0024BBBAB4|nr:MMPL family transporter [Planococcus sp. S3-L1]MDJ0331193.1 MMPL family transporter [Planococcus sp. S3-L1]
MHNVLKFKWPITIGLIVLTVVLFLLAPNLTKQAEDAGSFQLSDEASSQLASKILSDADAAEQTISLVIPLENKITDATRQTLEQMVTDIEALGEPITSVLNPVESKELEEQLISEDGQTVLMPIMVDGTNEEVNAVADTIRETIIPKDLTAYITGEAIIGNDVNISAQEGLKRTEIITVVLIFGLLLAVFRSIVTPFIPLVAVGISYLLSQSIVAFFIDWFGFPVSNYTQIFLVAILFGIGTDYCILLLSRYKEELSAGHGVEQSIINTYKTAGRTLLISGIAVFIGFFAIGFAEFPIFKSAVAVAVGIFVLLLVLYTIVPFFMSLLKEKLFWPAKKSASHSDSKLWITMSKLSINRPLLSMLVVALITVPLLFTYDNSLSFNTVDEIGSEYESVKGLRAIEEGFGKGDSLPVQVIVKSADSLTERSTVPYFESLSAEIEKIDGVETVRSITRPTGEVIDELYVDEQLGLLADGLGEARDGLGEVQTGLTEVQTNLTAISEQAGNSAGLTEAAAGLGQINQQLGQVSQGLQLTGNIPQTIGALTQISGGLTEIQQGLAGAAGQTAELSAGLTQLAEGVGASNAGLAEIETGLTEAVDMMQEMSDSESVRDTGLFIPEGTLEGEDFEQVLDRYSFADGTGMMMEVILSEDPYSHEAIDITAEIKETVARTVAGTPLEDAEIAFSGISSINSDLEEVSSSDFTNTVIIMLISLFVVLAILFRSLIMPLYMIGSLLLTYYTSISIAELIFVNGLGFDGISWAVPFFGFVMLVALGVDYSIFLLDRFREESSNGVTVRDAMRTSMAKMGTVIITAAIILAGTFGAMMPSGVLSLVQIATIVITGLLLYGLIVLPLLIPAISVSFDRGVWWPFGKKK